MADDRFRRTKERRLIACGYRRCLWPFCHNTVSVWQTDRRTDGIAISILRAECMRTRAKTPDECLLVQPEIALSFAP